MNRALPSLFILVLAIFLVVHSMPGFTKEAPSIDKASSAGGPPWLGAELRQKDDWKAVITITRLGMGSLSGTIHFGRFDCGGDLIYDGRRDGGYVFRENLTYGSCRKGCDVWIKDDGSEYRETCSGSLTGGGPLENGQGASANVSWLKKELREADAWKARIRIVRLDIGSLAGTIHFVRFGCGGDLIYEGRSNGEYVFRESLTYGDCKKGCMIWLKEDGGAYRETCGDKLEGGGSLTLGD